MKQEITNQIKDHRITGTIIIITTIIIIVCLAITGCSQPEPATQKQETEAEVSIMRISSVFENNGIIPVKYTCDGMNISPPITIEEVPESTKSLVLIMDDPDAPIGTWDHWVVFNIPPSTTIIPEGSEPEGVSGANSWGRKGYGGPCPPDKEHRYFFRVYAIDSTLDLPEGSTKEEVLKAIEGHIIESATLIGRYDRRR